MALKVSEVENVDYLAEVKEKVVCPACEGILVNPKKCSQCKKIYCANCIQEESDQNDSNSPNHDCLDFYIDPAPEEINECLDKLVFVCILTYEEKTREITKANSPQQLRRRNDN